MRYEYFVLLISMFIRLSDATSQTGSFQLLMDQIEINDARTIYVCQGFNMPLSAPNQTFDMINFKTIVKNENLIHHMLLFVCPDQVELDEKPHLCSNSRASQQCNEWVAQWSIGMPLVNHVNQMAGFRAGKGFSRKFYLQVHMESATIMRTLKTKTNQSSIIEKPGFEISWTTNLRSNIASSVQIGQESLQIPSMAHELKISGACRPSECLPYHQVSSNAPMLHITRAYLHMHELGALAELLHLINDANQTRVKQKLILMASELDYDYMKPQVHLFNDDHSFVMSVNDSLIINCYFSSDKDKRHRTSTIRWGEGANAEMCYGFINYYPKLENFNRCVQNEKSYRCA